MYNQQQGFNSNNYPAQTHTPSSSIISASSATNSPRNFAASTGSNSTAMANYAYYNQQLPQHPQQLQQQRDIRQVGFKKELVDWEDSPAAQNGIKVGDRLHAVNNQNINGATREQAVDYLLALGDEVNLRVESSHNQDEFSHINGGQLGDSFYIRTHFPYSKRSNNKQELNFQSGDIFHVTDTLLEVSKAGYWQVTKVYSVNESDSKGSHAGDMANGGIIPNSKTAEVLAKQARMDSSTLGRSIFRKRLQSRRTNCWRGNPPFTDIPLPAYERVALKKPAFHRPVVIYGPLADVARQLLLSNFGQRFGAAIVDNYMLQDNNQQQPGDRPIRMSSIDTVMASQRHCVLSISPGSVERLQLAQYAPIVVLIDVDSRNRIRDLRSKSGATTLSAKKLMEQASKIKKHHAHLLTATLDASKEDGWFEALRHLIFHLQERRTPDDNKGDYGIYDATGANSVQATPTHKQNTTVDPAAVPALNIGGGVYAGPNSGPNASGSSIGGVSGGRVASNGSGSNSPFFAAFARSSPYSHSYRNVYGTTPTTNPGNYAENNYVTNQAPPTNTRVPGHPSDSSVTGYYDVKQILAEHYPETAANSRPSRLSATSSPYAQQQQQSSSPRPPPFGGGSNRFNDVQQRHTNDDFANNNNKDSIGASATVNYSLSPGKSLTNPGSISPAMRQSTSSINPAAADPIVIEHVHGVIDWKGGRLKCPESGVELIVPESAIPFGCQQELFVKVCRENQQNPPLDSDKQEALMSPLVMCGPQGIRFEVPVELKLPSNSPDTTSSQTSFVLKSGSGANWRNIELARPPKRNHPADKFVSVLVNHF
uniref:Tight junction protein ZO-1 n=1 Tax=Ditylenchus dipsaci TaxID=166011 RepID=A0A915DXI2_9BILA